MNKIKLLIEFWDIPEYEDYYNNNISGQFYTEELDAPIFQWVEKVWGIKRDFTPKPRNVNQFIHTYEIVDEEKFCVFLLENSKHVEKYD